ncbi:MAG: hypothetical protein AAI978_00040 [Candidatus Hodgkinia cicadicola]
MANLRYALCSNVKLLLVNVGLNPRVNCSIHIEQWLLAAATCWGGKPHAEVVALSKLMRERATLMFVSLEPCASFGKTPPCAYLLLASGLLTLLVARLDKTQQLGFRLLKPFVSFGLISALGANVLLSVLTKRVNTCFGQIGINCGSKMTICCNAPSCLRFKASALCVTSSTLGLDNSVLIARASVLSWGGARVVTGLASLRLSCGLVASCSCCLTIAEAALIANSRLPLFKISNTSSGINVFELGYLTSRAAINTTQFAIVFPFLEGLFCFITCSLLKKRLFWCNSTSLSVRRLN